jgi:DNA internalization-related competence protein ComEC/Rec2
MARPFYWLSFPLLLGVLLSSLLPIGPLAGLAAAGGCAALAWPRSRIGLVALACGALLLGWAAPGAGPVGPQLEGLCGLRGRVMALRSGGAQLVSVEAVRPAGGDWEPARGRVLVDFGEAAPRPGWQVVVRGRARALVIDALPGAADSDRVALLAGARARLQAGGWAPLGVNVDPGLSPPDCRHRGILLALALGDRGELAPELAPLLRSTGTSHLLAISGLHLGLVAGLVGWLVSRLARIIVPWRPRSRAWLLGGLAMSLGACGYGWLAAWPVSAIRAALMVTVVGLGLGLGRGRDPRQLLGLAVWGTVLVEPAVVGSASWQLSFGAVLGLLTLGPRLASLLPLDSPLLLERVAQGAVATIAATIGTLPAAAWWFQDLALTAVPANLLAMPLVGLVATPGALLSVLLPGLPGHLAAAVACGALDLALAWLRLIEGPMLHPAVGPVGALLLVAVPLATRRPALGVLAALLALGLRIRPAGRLVLSFLAVGQGSALLVEWPDGRRWLVDAGPAPQAVLHHLRRRGIRHLDVVALTHPHPDHLGGLAAVLDAVRPDALWLPRLPRAGEDDFAALVAGVEPGLLRLPDHPSVPALHPLDGWRPERPAVNDESLVLWLAYGRHTALITGDVEAQAEGALLPGLVPVDVLAVPHHGSRSSSGHAFVQALRPRVAVVSCGRDNRFGHPHPEVVHRYRDSLLLRTDLHGTVEVSSDGLELMVRTWLPGQGWRALTPPAGAYASGSSCALPTCSVGSSAPTSWAASSPLSLASSESSRKR